MSKQPSRKPAARRITVPDARHAPSEPRHRAAFLRALALAERFADAAWTLADLQPLDAAEVAAAQRHVPERWRAKLRAYAQATWRSAQVSREFQDAEAGSVNDSWQRVARAADWARVVETTIVQTVRWCARASRPADEGLARLRELHPKEGARIQRETFETAVDAAGTNAMWDFIANVAREAMPNEKPEPTGAAIQRRHQPSRRT